MNSRLFAEPTRLGVVGGVRSSVFKEAFAEMNRRDDISGDLSDVRRDIDEVDDRILELLIRRFRAVRKVKEIKGLDHNSEDSPLRPARESQIIRRLIEAANGELSPTFVAALWYEILAASSRQQAPINIHVLSNNRRVDFQDLVRLHSGAEPAIIEHGTALDAHEAVAASKRDIMMCPWSEEPDELSDLARQSIEWLLARPEAQLNVIGKLPFIPGSTPVQAIVIGRVPFDASGDDTTLVALRWNSFDAETFSDTGFTQCGPVFSCCEGSWQVCPVDGYVKGDDERLDAVDKIDGVEESCLIGGYANPIDPGGDV